MPLSTDALPNLPLTGSEVMEYSIALVREYAPKYQGVPFKAELQFTMQNPALPKYSISILIPQGDDVKCPVCKGEIPADQTIICETCCGEFQVPNTPELALETLATAMRNRMTFDWVFGSSWTYPRIQYAITISLIAGTEWKLSQRSLTGQVLNPNLVRVHYNLPIRQAEKILPTEDNPMGGLRFGLLEFNKADYPAPDAPVEENLTPEVGASVVIDSDEEKDPEDVPDDFDDSEDMESNVAEYARVIGYLTPETAETKKSRRKKQ